MRADRRGLSDEASGLLSLTGLPMFRLFFQFRVLASVYRRSAHSLLARYETLVAAGAIERDAAQIDVLRKLDRLLQDLAERGAAPARETALGFARRALSLFSRARREKKTPRGLYIWGHVGRGKTTLMDLFFDALDVANKRRAHFHAFMADVHDRLHRARRTAASDGAPTDPVTRVAAQLAKETRVLCFDEFSITDIADATILGRLFTALLEAGVVVVATSNVEPARLYEDGRNRDLFLPFIALLQERLDVVRLDARTDFRLEKQCFGEVYHTPPGEVAKRAIDALFRRLTGRSQGEPMTIEVKRRKIEIPQAADRVARFYFEDLCARPLGASDYMELTRNFDTIIVERVPAMGMERRNEAKRFMTLVDVLYEAKVKLVLSAEKEARELYRADHGHEAMEFARTVSRLIEMRSEEYLQNLEA
jgi:cell division protein ZapE